MDKQLKYPLVRFVEACLQSEGSLWVEEERLKSFARKRKVDVSPLDNLCKSGKLKRLRFDGVNYISLPTFHAVETEGAYNVMRILYNDTLGKVPAKTIDGIIDKIENKIGIELHSEQRKAVHTMVNNGLCVITGGPGTGKTCTLNTAVQVIEELYPGITIKFTAPTGKASGRITESVHRPARTVQRELKLTYTKKYPDYFTGDILVIDEVSMLDMETAGAVFKAVRNGQRLIMIGDTEQLPSVGAGAVLRDLLDSGVIPNTRLTKTFRQAEESALFCNILLAKKGDPKLKNDNEEFVIIKALGGDKTLNQIADKYLEEKEKWGLENVCCLIPYRKAGTICSNKLNNILQARINPKSLGKKYLDVKTGPKEYISFIVGDPVMQLQNRDECANGDVGMVIDVEGERLVVRFKDPMGEEVIVKYWKSQLAEELSLAYAMSINKSQGSEYKSVIMCMAKEHSLLLSRNMLYTGITRAKKKVVYIHEPEATKMAMSNTAMYANINHCGRVTLFGEKLRFYKQRFEQAARAAA